MLRMFVFIGLIFLCTACDATRQTTLPLGEWGGEQVALVVTQTGGILEYSCATGTIGEAIRPDKQGDFSVKGTHTPGTGIEPPEELRPKPFSVLYIGNTDGKIMTLHVSAPGDPNFSAHYTLKFGATPKLFKCL